MSNVANKICAVIVSFHPEQVILQSLMTILPQVAGVVVVDNGSKVAELGNIYSLKKQFSNLEIIELGKNLGLAAAQNQGISWALSHDFSHVLLLDQDSVPAANMIDTLMKAYQLLSTKENKVAAVGPQFYDDMTSHAAFFLQYRGLSIHRLFCPPNQKNCIFPVDFLIASGCMICLTALQKIGFKDDELFIDHIDTDWCLRAKALGYHLYGICDAKLLHRLGESTIPIRFLGKRWNIAKHSPLRNYYVFRNTILLCYKPYVSKQWVAISILRLFKFFLFYGFMVAPRWQRIKMMLKGIVDGFRKKIGQYSA